MSFANGRLPDSALAPIPGGRLIKEAAAAWNDMCAEAHRRGLPVPEPEGPLSSYRTFAQQEQEKAEWTAKGLPDNAATPGQSNHGWGRAVDVIAAARATVREIGARFGFWIGPGGWSDAPWEDWHAVYKLGSYKPPREWPFLPLKQGSKGLWVFVLTGRLRNCGYREHLMGRGPLMRRRGRFDADVKRAVERFQHDQRLAVDGVVGARTWARLKAAERAHKQKKKGKR